MKCQAGCISFDGGEKKHRKDCDFYPESLTKMWHDTEAELTSEIERLNRVLDAVEEAAPDIYTAALVKSVGAQ